MAGSVHRRAFGRHGLGSPATQLMRAVRPPPPGGVAELCLRHTASWAAPRRRRAASILVKSVDGVAAARLNDRRPCFLAGAIAGWSSTVCRDIQGRWVCRVERGAATPNERRQLTWLTGCPKPAGLGSPASRRAVRPRLPRHAAVASRWVSGLPRS